MEHENILALPVNRGQDYNKSDYIYIYDVTINKLLLKIKFIRTIRF